MTFAKLSSLRNILFDPKLQPSDRVPGLSSECIFSKMVRMMLKYWNSLLLTYLTEVQWNSLQGLTLPKLTLPT